MSSPQLPASLWVSGSVHASTSPSVKPRASEEDDDGSVRGMPGWSIYNLIFFVVSSSGIGPRPNSGQWEVRKSLQSWGQVSACPGKTPIERQSLPPLSIVRPACNAWNDSSRVATDLRLKPSRMMESTRATDSTALKLALSLRSQYVSQ